MPDFLRFLCFAIAVLCFVVASIRGEDFPFGRRTIGLIALGLAFAFTPFLWDATLKLSNS